MDTRKKRTEESNEKKRIGEKTDTKRKEKVEMDAMSIKAEPLEVKSVSRSIC